MTKLIEIWRLIKRYWQYSIVIGLLAVVAVWGANITTPIAQPQMPSSARNLICSASGQQAKVYADENGLIRLGDYFRTDVNESYRLIAGLSVEQDKLLGAIKFADPDVYLNWPKNISVAVILEDGMGHQLELGVVDVPTNGHLVPKEFVYVAQQNFRTLVIRPLKTLPAKAQIILNNWQMYHVPTQVLRPTEFGQPDIHTATTSQKTQVSDQLALLKSHPAVGVLLRGSGERLLSTTFYLSQAGNGGIGEYQVQLRPAREQNSEVIVEDQLLARLNFQSIDLTQVRALTRQPLDPGQAVPFNFSFGGILEPGQLYFLGISAENVATNWRHHLNIGLDPDAAATSQMLGGLQKDGSKWQQGKFPAARLEVAVPDSQALTVGAQVEDLGGGVGNYRFRLHHNPKDLLVSQLPAVGSSDFSPPSFDFNSKNVVSQSLLQRPLGLRFAINFAHPFLETHLLARQQCRDVLPAQIEYSFDQTNWRAVETKPYANAFNPRIDTVIRNPGRFTTLYLRVTPSSAYFNERASNQYLTISDLDIFSTLRLP